MQRITRKLARFRALPPRDRRTVLSAMALLPLFWIALHLLGLQRLQARLHRQPRPRSSPPDLDEMKRLGALVNSTSRHVLGPANCLTRSLYLWWLLRRKGVYCHLRIGVRLSEGALEAHAWVERAGIPLNDRHDVGALFDAFAEPMSPSRFLSP
ncbi:MAG: hypothetical protein QG662_1403 [Pseudomonadota bacterium]|nr:hypothetical protein [Pseudomonadota bacterium]